LAELDEAVSTSARINQSTSAHSNQWFGTGRKNKDVRTNTFHFVFEAILAVGVMPPSVVLAIGWTVA
jgi:hypothetical protein